MKAIAGFFLFVLSSGPAASAGEVWVVGSAGRSAKVVDTASESVIATIPLSQGAGAPAARGIAFSTQDGIAGAYAFAGQGATLHVLDAGAKEWIWSVDLGAAVGLPIAIVDLESSPNRAFVGDGGPEVRAYLVVAADAVRQTGSDPEPYWIVLDPRALVQSPPPVPLVAGSGFLHEPHVPAGDRGRAAGVTVLGAPRGPSFFRAWIASRVPGSPEIMRATLLEKGASIDAPWLVGRSTQRALPMGRSAPESFAVAAPHDGQAQLFPTGAAGALADLGHGGSCELPANLGAAAVRGPGPGGYQIVTVDLDAGDLLRVNESTCAFQRTPLGSGPVDLTVEALFEHGAAWVANRDSDDVSVVRPDGSSARVPLGIGSGTCVECPVSIEARPGAGRACTTSLRLAKGSQGVMLAWDTVGCTGTSYAVYCQCDRRLDLDCPCACDPASTPGCFGSLPVDGQPGIESGLPGPLGPLARLFPGPDPIFPAYPPEPVIQLGLTGTTQSGGGDDGGVVVIGTRP